MERALAFPSFPLSWPNPEGSFGSPALAWTLHHAQHSPEWWTLWALRAVQGRTLGPGLRDMEARGGTPYTGYPCGPHPHPHRGQGRTHHANEFHLLLPILLSVFPLQVTFPHLGDTWAQTLPTLHMFGDVVLGLSPRMEQQPLSPEGVLGEVWAGRGRQAGEAPEQSRSQWGRGAPKPLVPRLCSLRPPGPPGIPSSSPPLNLLHLLRHNVPPPPKSTCHCPVSEYP